MASNIYVLVIPLVVYHLFRVTDSVVDGLRPANGAAARSSSAIVVVSTKEIALAVLVAL